MAACLKAEGGKSAPSFCQATYADLPLPMGWLLGVLRALRCLQGQEDIAAKGHAHKEVKTSQLELRCGQTGVTMEKRKKELRAAVIRALTLCQQNVYP